MITNWIGVFVVLYIGAGVFAAAINTEKSPESQLRDAVFWPIVVVKWVLINLVLVLFTGWNRD